MLNKLYMIVFCVILLIGSAFAEPISITPVEKISTSTKQFAVGNKYNFKDTKTGEIYSAEVTYYQPNGMYGQEAQVEFGNFINSSGKNVNGKITVIPSNHKNFQEYTNYFVNSCTLFIRGSEVILLPNKHVFLLNYNNNENLSKAIKITPIDKISTVYDELEIGDIIEFKVVYDVYKDGKLYIKQGTPILGEIDYVHENGWLTDNAEIYFNHFTLKDVNGNNLNIDYDLTINGFEILKYKSKRSAQFFNYISVIFRGKEIDIKSYDKDAIFSIIIE